MRSPKVAYTWTATGAGAGLIRFNPCGKAVAQLRDSYETQCRFFRDSAETVTIRWVPCQPGAQALDWESPISSLRWKGQPWFVRGVGEVFGAPVKFIKPAPIPGADGLRVCGTREDFERGGVYDPDSPPMTYSAEGLAICCGPDPGGIELGGESPPAPPYCSRYKVTAGAGLGLILTASPPAYPEQWGAPAWPGPYGWQLEGPFWNGVADRWRYTVDGIGYGITDGWDGQGSADFYFPSGGPFMATITCWP